MLRKKYCRTHMHWYRFRCKYCHREKVVDNFLVEEGIDLEDVVDWHDYS